MNNINYIITKKFCSLKVILYYMPINYLKTIDLLPRGLTFINNTYEKYRT